MSETKSETGTLDDALGPRAAEALRIVAGATVALVFFALGLCSRQTPPPEADQLTEAQVKRMIVEAIAVAIPPTPEAKQPTDDARNGETNKYGFKRGNLPTRYVWPNDCNIGGGGVVVGGYRYDFSSIYECKTQFARWESWGELWIEWKAEP